MKPVIAVCGSDGDDPDLSSFALQTAEKVGELIAKGGGILICGGRGGVMRAACKGAKKEGGTTIGILPFSRDEANEYVDIALPTGLGNLRDYIIVHSADVIIAISGRWGTLNEITYAMILKKPLLLMSETGGCVDQMACKKILPNVPASYYCVSTAEEAVSKAFSLSKNL